MVVVQQGFQQFVQLFWVVVVEVVESVCVIEFLGLCGVVVERGCEVVVQGFQVEWFEQVIIYVCVVIVLYFVWFGVGGIVEDQDWCVLFVLFLDVYFVCQLIVVQVWYVVVVDQYFEVFVGLEFQCYLVIFCFCYLVVEKFQLLVQQYLVGWIVVGDEDMQVVRWFYGCCQWVLVGFRYFWFVLV